MGILELSLLLTLLYCQEALGRTHGFDGEGHSGNDYAFSADYDVQERKVLGLGIKLIHQQLDSVCNYNEWRRLQITEFWIDHFSSKPRLVTEYQELNKLTQQSSDSKPDAVSISILKSVCFLGWRLYECMPMVTNGVVEFKCGCMTYPVNTTTWNKGEQDAQCLVRRGELCAPKKTYGPAQMGEFQLFLKACDTHLYCEIESQTCQPYKCNSTKCFKGGVEDFRSSTSLISIGLAFLLYCQFFTCS